MDALSMNFKDAAHVALLFAWSDTKARYRRSTLGPFWIVIGTAIGAAGLGYLWSNLMNADPSIFVPSLTIGLIVWQLIVGCVSESANVFVRNASIIRNMKIPFLFFPTQMLFRHLITFAHNAIVIIAVLIIFPPPISAVQLLVIPGLFLVAGNLLWIALLIGMLGARLRDLDYMINAILPMFFFISPVMFRPSNLTINPALVWGNPFSYLITIIRSPLEGSVPPLFVYVVTIVMLGADGQARCSYYAAASSA
jgi:ABC-type polysaccharide/polyol phosphate export permease